MEWHRRGRGATVLGRKAEALGLRGVAVVEGAAAHERDAHRLEIAGRHRVTKEWRAVISGAAVRVFLEHRAINVLIAAQRQLAGEASRDDSGNGAHALQGS